MKPKAPHTTAVAERGESLWFRADALADVGRHREAVELFRRAAYLGCNAAYGRLAIAFHDGTGVRRSPAIALHYYKRALRVGDTGALNNIGVLRREQGRLSEAARWFQRAVDAGNDDALLQLAKLGLQRVGMTRTVRDQLRRVVRSNTCTIGSREEAADLLRENGVVMKAHRRGRGNEDEPVSSQNDS